MPFKRTVRAATSLAFSLCLSAAALTAQQLPQTSGSAAQVDLVAQVGAQSMQDLQNRAVFLAVKSRPQMFQDPSFYLSFVVSLIQGTPEFRCQEAFANEFERQAYFRDVMQLQQPILDAVLRRPVPQFIDVAYQIDTGEYDFNRQRLPFSNREAKLGAQILAEGTEPRYASRRKACAENLLRGLNLDLSRFPWRFEIQDLAGGRTHRDFIFGSGLTLSSSDAQTLLQRFGRTLYAIVTYQMRIAPDASTVLQAVPTDGHIFGLSSDSVVRVNSYRHPSIPPLGYLDMSNRLFVSLGRNKADALLTFEQTDFRAVGQGVRTTRGPDNLAQALNDPVSGSAAVGHNSFIIRLTWPFVSNLSGQNAAPSRFITLYGTMDSNAVTETQAPVAGRYSILEFRADEQKLRESRGDRFNGAFWAEGYEPPQPAPNMPDTQLESQLDELLVAPGETAEDTQTPSTAGFSDAPAGQPDTKEGAATD